MPFGQAFRGFLGALWRGWPASPGRPAATLRPLGPGELPAGAAPEGRPVYPAARPPCYPASAMADAFAVPGELREGASRAVPPRVPVPPPDPVEGSKACAG